MTADPLPDRQPATVASLLACAREQGLDRLDAQLLVAHALHRPRVWLIAHDTDVLPPDDAERAWQLLARRAAGEPVAYLLGEKEFHGLMLRVTPDVLIPRPDTETLVEWALDCLRSLPPGAAVADLGTGSGAIALAIKQARPDAVVCAVDASPAALAVARDNGSRLALDVEWLAGSWWTPLAGRRFDLIASNPPYIAEGDAHLSALAHEPLQALTAGPDGLADLRQLIAGATAHLRPGGWLLLEHGWDQAEAVRALLQAAGWADVATRHDLAGQPRCTGGRWPG
ncbi:MAG: peptide chain release factor N(5)-glutamine methyltransferase [Burkholderiales bacterium]|nr:peptide chain release factor N(5)-glutamine methyltransferase [Burkholderiales bacterium]